MTEEEKKNLQGIKQLGYANPDEGELQGFANLAITGDQLAPVSSMQVQPVEPAPIPSVSSLPITEPPKPDMTAPVRSAEDILAQLEGRDIKAEVSNQTTEQQRSLNEINQRIRLHQAEALRAETEAEKMGETLGGQGLAIQQARRESAIKAIELSALAQAAQGNLALSNDLATQAVEAKYRQKENELKTQRANILANYESFTSEEKKKADAVLLRIDRDDAFLKEQKENKNKILGIATTAASNGADSLTLDKISKAKTPEEALIAAGRFNQKPEKKAETNALGILDVARYNELYPGAGIVAGDTEAVANAKVAALNSPEGQIKAAISVLKSEGADYNSVIKEINEDKTIIDKATAKRIAAETFGVQSEIKTPIFGKNNFANIDVDSRISQLNESLGSLATDKYLREQLTKDGYPKEEINKRMGFLNKISNFLFGE